MNSNTETSKTGTGTVGSTVLGYPRQGRDRELKRAVEAYWRGSISRADLFTRAAEVRAQRYAAMAGLTEVPVGDFSLYDHVLDTAWMFGAVPNRFGNLHQGSDLDTFFALARGTAEIAPLEMTKWFDTNYHYLVPELDASIEWRLRPDRLLDQIREAQAIGARPRAVVLGPVTFLTSAKASASAEPGFRPLSLIDTLLPRYVELLATLAEAGVDWVQLDEPILATDLDDETFAVLEEAYRTLAAAASRPKLLLAHYFGHLGARGDAVFDLPVDGFALDLAGAAAADVSSIDGRDLSGRRLLVGVVDGRNVWRTDLAQALEIIAAARASGAQVDVATSCSLLHVPIDTGVESAISAEVLAWLAFADQKIAEVITLADGCNAPDAVRDQVDEATRALQARAASPITHVGDVRRRVAALTPDDLVRQSAYPDRVRRQHDRLGLPALPTTTIGSFPQTAQIRRARSEHTRGRLDDDGYRTAMRAEIDRVVGLQEELGVDVVVHGEAERNDMVQYFADGLTGVIGTEHGWVQSYGTRCVRPPIIVGDVERPEPITAAWSVYAQSLTERPVKGMLTGPVTMLAWSFVRDDQPAADTARQMALALRSEVNDLERAGIGIIQVDEPALRETLPLRRDDRPDYLRWAVDAFKITTAGVDDATQIHTHMCYAEFGDITAAIDELDADVISLESARSRMEIVAELADAGYPREIGPGVWDIHSPRVPSTDEIADHLRTAVSALPADRVWVNPDCGLKTRGWPETEASLKNLVAAAAVVRAEVSG